MRYKGICYMSKFSFPKEEKLKSTKTISKLFKEGSGAFSYPVKFVYSISKVDVFSNPKVAVSVSGKIFKRATDRNLLKRRLRESYRLNKNILTENLVSRNLHLQGMFIFIGKEICTYDEIAKGINGVLQKIHRQIDSGPV